MVPVPLMSMLAQNGTINLVPNIGNEEGIGLLNGLLKLITPFSLTCIYKEKPCTSLHIYVNIELYVITLYGTYTFKCTRT